MYVGFCPILIFGNVITLRLKRKPPLQSKILDYKGGFPRYHLIDAHRLPQDIDSLLTEDSESTLSHRPPCEPSLAIRAQSLGMQGTQTVLTPRILTSQDLAVKNDFAQRGPVPAV